MIIKPWSNVRTSLTQAKINPHRRLDPIDSKSSILLFSWSGDEVLLLQRCYRAPVQSLQRLPAPVWAEKWDHRLWRGDLRWPAPGHPTLTMQSIHIYVKDIPVEKAISHPEYGISTSGLALNDIMLVKLRLPVEYNAWVRPVCLPDMWEHPYIDKQFSVCPSKNPILYSVLLAIKFPHNMFNSLSSKYVLSCMCCMS